MKVHYGITPHWIGEIIQYDSFCKAVESVWKNLSERLSKIYSYIDETVLPLMRLGKMIVSGGDEDRLRLPVSRAGRIKRCIAKKYSMVLTAICLSVRFFIANTIGNKS